MADDNRGSVSAGLTQYSLQQQWDMVQPQDHRYVYSHVTAWEKMAGLCDAMAKALRDAAARIAERWPPDRSQAAHAFHERLSILATAFDQSAQKSRVNRTLLWPLQLDNASYRGDIGALINEWKATHDRVLARIRYSHPTRASGAFKTEDDYLAFTNQPNQKERTDAAIGPVPNNWKQLLDSRARGIASNYERSVSQYKGGFEVTTPVQPTLPVPDQTTTKRYHGGGGYDSNFLKSLVLPPHQIPYPDTSTDTSGDDDGSDPILDSTIPGGYPGYPGEWTPQPLPGGSGPLVPTAGGGYAMAPGGVIGAPAARAVGSAMMPMTGAGAPARPAAAGGGAGRSGYVAPPGGMIGGRPGGGGAGGAVPAARGGGGRQADDEDAYIVPSGGPGVLVPQDDPEDHRPGPGVIGIDR